ncbi:MAG: ribosome maturation factor RimP [Bdellovibrionales bacterium]|nr:ribosome maturation factor RimP [Bdellovibrionales bacterium]
MISDSAWKKLEALADEVSQRESCRLYDMEFTSRKGQRILRVYIDAIENGVSIDQCADVSKGLSLLLDVEDLVPGGHYELEVSSPGVERPLRLPWHFKKALGEKVKVKTSKEVSPMNRELKKNEKIKSLMGQLTEVADDKIILNTGNDNWEIPYEIIHKANVVFEFGDTNKSKQRGK